MRLTAILLAVFAAAVAAQQCDGGNSWCKVYISLPQHICGITNSSSFSILPATDVSSTPATLATVSTNSVAKRVALAAMVTAVSTALTRVSARAEWSSTSLSLTLAHYYVCLSGGFLRVIAL
jgi:hypothetical protein